MFENKNDGFDLCQKRTSQGPHVALMDQWRYIVGVRNKYYEKAFMILQLVFQLVP